MPTCWTQALAPVAALPHVGAVAGTADKERQVRLVRHLYDEVERRRRFVAESGGGRIDSTDPACPFPLVVLLLDN